MSLSRAPAVSRVRVAIAGASAALLAVPLGAVVATAGTAHAAGVTFTILHTNDFHGQLQPSGSNPGLARVAAVVDGVRSSVGAANTLLVDSGDEMQGSLLSNLQQGAPTIAAFSEMGYNLATFGNHEFDWGQSVLNQRTTQATYPFLTSNIVKNDTGNCATAGWTAPDTFKSQPFSVQTVAGIKVGFIGVTSTETPTITVSTATQGLCFKDPATSISHYYQSVKNAGAQVVVIMSHLGLNDGGYGYGLPVYGDKTLAQKLIDAGTPANIIIGGHSHTNMLGLTPPGAVKVGDTTIAQAYYNGRQLGQFDVTVDGSNVSVSWKSNVISTTGVEDPDVKGVIDAYANDPTYQALVNQPIGYSAVDLPRNGGTVDNMMGDFVDDAIYNYLNTDGDSGNNIDVFFNNAGGIRADWCWNGSDWVNTGCSSGTHTPGLLTYGDMFTILPFGNATVVGTMTGAQIVDVLNHGPQVTNGTIQPAGLKYKYYAYKDSNPGPQPFAWGAFDYSILDKSTGKYVPVDLNKTYKVGTNEFLAPAGGDGYNAFKYMTNITYWGDMLNAVDAYVSAHYGTSATAYKGPTGNGTLDSRILRDGTDTPDSGTIKPVTVLHHNDSHGNLAKGTYVGYTQLATLIKQERLHNPTRTLLLDGGDAIQGDAMMYYFKSAPSGKAADGTTLPPALTTHPMMAALNAMGYTAFVLGNHEFNFGSDVFKGIFNQAQFPVLGANVKDDGQYGLATANGGNGVKPYVEVTVGGISVGILGITNHRVPNYELPSNIKGLTFSDPIAAAQQQSNTLRSRDDALVALTHIGFTTNPKSVEVDNNVDTNLAAQVTGVDAIVGAHSHTNPASPEAPYKYLPAIVAGPGNTPVIVSQAYRYNNTLGEEVLGMRAVLPRVIADISKYFAEGSIDNAGIKSSLLDKLTYAQASLAVGRTADALGAFNAFVNAVKAQRGKHITTAVADKLIADGNYMISHKGGNEVAARAGQYLTVASTTTEDPTIKAIVDPYVTALNSYYTKVVGTTTVPIDTTKAFTEETNGANLQADAAVWELNQHGIAPDIHLSGAMTNKLIPAGTLTIADMFAGMPYENSLVTLRMNGPELKAVLERAYRNYYYYKYVPGYGGYSYYTTCMIDTNSIGKITYDDQYPSAPNGNNVVSLTINGQPVNFADATKEYLVSTVNYLAAGSCNFNDNGVSLWPLNKIVNDTQYYVRDAVIDYITNKGTVSPAIEGRLVFN